MEACRNSPVLRVPDIPDHIEHAWYKCYAFIRTEALKTDWSRDRFVAEVVARGVPCYSGTCSEVYLEKAFDDTGLRPAEQLPVAQDLGDISVMFLVHPTLTLVEIHRTCDTIAEVSRAAVR